MGNAPAACWVVGASLRTQDTTAHKQTTVAEHVCKSCHAAFASEFAGSEDLAWSTNTAHTNRATRKTWQLDSWCRRLVRPRWPDAAAVGRHHTSTSFMSRFTLFS